MRSSRHWLVLGLLVCGCAPVAPPPASETPPSVQTTLRVGDEKDFATLLGEARGQVVLVDFWATWCGPCVELLPHTLELGRRHAQRGLRVVTVSFDTADNEAAVGNLLRAQPAAGSNVTHLLSRYGAGTRSVEAFAAGEGALPCLKLFDRQGRLHATFGGDGTPIDPQKIDRAVESLLR